MPAKRKLPMRRALAALLLTVLTLPAAAATYDGKVALVEGTATINGKRASVGQLVKAGDVVRTGAKSRLDLLWGRGRASRLMPNSELKVARTDAQQQQMSLSWGGLLSIIRAKGPFRTTSANAVAAVTGTVYYHEETKEHPGYVCVCSGTVQIGHPAAAHTHKPLTASHHTAVHSQTSGHQPAPMVSHTDADIQFLDQYLVHQEEELDP